MKFIKFISLLLGFLVFGTLGNAQNMVLPIYEGNPPNALPSTDQEHILHKDDLILVSHIQNPTIEVFLPTKRMATGQAVIICPGGGYWVLAYDLEGSDIAKYFNSIGIAAFVLKYRLPTSSKGKVLHEMPLMDAQRAMRTVRSKAKEWNINPGKIGIMGFSAGGHLAATLSTHFDYGNSGAKDTIEQVSCRPDFSILMYPVISFVDPTSHAGSSENLIGKNPDQTLLKYYSGELNVNEDTPTAFIVNADDDDGVPAENALLYYQALRAKHIPAELHIISEGGHGFGLGTGNEHISTWTTNLKWWLNSLLPK